MSIIEEYLKAENFHLLGDNGEITDQDVTKFKELISLHEEPLQAIALKLLTSFTRRCSWSLAVALTTIYVQLLNNSSQVHSRIILIYLVFRVAELDGTDINSAHAAQIGHMFMPFLIQVANGDEFRPGCRPEENECFVARRLLSSKGDTIAYMSADGIVNEMRCSQMDDYSAASLFFSTQSARWPQFIEEKDNQVDLVLAKLFTGKVLNMNETRTILDAISKASLNSNLILQFEQLSRKALSKLIEEHAKIAPDVIYKLVEKKPLQVHYYICIMMEMDLSVQCVESVLKLYTGNLELEREPLRAFVSHCLSSCDEAMNTPGKQSRQVRMVCLFVSSLLKKEMLPVEQLYSELNHFILRYSQHKETTNLYQALAEARSRIIISI